ncbi:glutamate--cysteine ligase [Nonomuraea cavernae]|uniref:glutamate--cysteine ligase n=1 Tax=Nonomuraea cavernae TaxID=2045107 RepID=UPI001664023F|nr:glutamate--cysteine ligase [Nonomuraea cavernae]MCA2189200.1 glutamate--cysteine ligase [Nonomuraea cavernae]
MGRDLDKERFSETEYARFGERLDEQLGALRELLDQPGFGEGPTTIGAELELFLVDGKGRPLPRNEEVRESIDDPRVVLELGRFNLEVNLTPVPLAGRPFERLGAEIQETVTKVDAAVGRLEDQGGALPIGILPTLDTEDFTREAISDQNRYRAMSRGVRRLRLEPFLVRIEDLELSVEDVILEAANTSWQVHIRTPPDRFARLFNAAQLATGPVLAVCGNSPYFLGRQLWEETRIALMEEAADDRDVERRYRKDGRVTFGSDWVREGAYELFERYVRDYDPILPDLTDDAGPLDVPELRLHQGTVWQWNRPVYDPADGGHLRVEMRALPAGPSCADMTANTAFLLGLTLAQAERDLTGYRFAETYQNFYRAAMHGLDAKLSWPGMDGEFEAPDLVLKLLPEARAALLAAGVVPDEVDKALGVIEERTRLRRTGAVWQREALARLDGDRNRLVREYRENALTGVPVHLWR